MSKFRTSVMQILINREQPIQERYIEGYTSYGNFQCYINNTLYTATRDSSNGYFRLDLSLDLNITSLADFCNGDKVNNNVTYLNLTNIGNTQNNESLYSFLRNQVSLTGVKFPSNFNTRKCKSVKQAFNGCQKLTTIDVSMFDLSSVGGSSSGDDNMSTFCYGCNGTKKLYLPTIPNTAYCGASTWYNMSSLTDIKCFGTIDSNSNKGVSFLQSTNLTKDSALNLINALADRTNTNSAKLILSSQTTSLLSNEDILIATNKNWQITNS